MAITRQKKEEVVASVRDHAKKSASIVFANFKRLTVNQQNELRRALRAQDIGYTVAKKTLVRRAFDGMYTGEMPVLDGEVSIAYGADELATAREMLVFVKKYPEQLAFAGGVFGGKYMSKEEIISIASIPGMDALRAQFLQLINSPRQRFAMVVKAKAEK
jgi:large subunit ribosomal protein L10